MKLKLLSSTTLAALTAVTFSPPPARADSVTDWNAIMQNTVTGNALVQARSAAIVQLAVFEAVNAITGDYEPYLGGISAPAGASADAAAIAAAHRTLVSLIPGAAANLNALRASSLQAIADGPAKDAGIAVGESAATAMLQLRSADGAAGAQDAPYTPGSGPGVWRPTPPSFASAVLPGWGQVVPFALEQGSQYRLPPPPALKGGRYLHDFDEVKSVGSVTSTSRPQDRTDVALYFNAAGAVQVWNPAARQASAAQGKTLSENAQILALLGMAICDASISSFETKYHYNFWRPVAAIRAASTDGNSRTDTDPGWSPLLPTPAFPSYPSGHAALSYAASTVLDRVFGNHGHEITLTSAALGIVLNYSSFREICDDIDDARVYGGIHFRFEQEAGARQGKDVGHYVLDNYLRPLADQPE
jgi:hypothetical protein